jgi:signal transduction histidine kinase
LYRVITLAYAAALIIRDHGRYSHPGAGFAVLCVMAAWTVVTVLACLRPGGCPGWLIGLDLALCTVLVLSSRLVETAAQVNAGAPTLPTVWVAGPVLACAVAAGPWIGLAGGLLIAAADGAERGTLFRERTFNGIVLVLIAGWVGGYVVRFGLRAERAVEQAARRDAAVAERERIARGVHDSVLQVLALVASRGRTLGGEAADLGRLAAEQEAALRVLLSASGPEPAEAGCLDVRTLIERVPLDTGANDQITVSCPATPVPAAADGARALAGATTEALGNVRRHAGPDAQAWVLLEDEGDGLRVTVRDDGAGFAAGRLAEAAAQGRLGVVQSIEGRLRAVGGSARLTSAPGQGTGGGAVCAPILTGLVGTDPALTRWSG